MDRKGWRVTFTLPKGSDRPWVQNKHALVLANDISEVEPLVKAKYPEATLYSITHLGGQEVIIAEG